MPSLPFRLAAAGLLSFALPLEAQQTVSVVADRDNTLFNDPSGAGSNGAGDAFIVGRAGFNTAQPIRRGIVHFPIDAVLPAGAIVLDARLVLNCSRVHPSLPLVTISVHRVSQDWGEGSSLSIGNQGQSAPSTNGDATWIHTFWPNQNWTNAGGDFFPQASAQTNVDVTGFYTWSGPGLTADVQAFVDQPNQNFGWILKSPESTSFTAKRFNSREHPLSFQRPKLEIDFLVPAAATPFGNGCASSAGTTVQLDANGAPAIGNSSFALQVSGGRPSTAVALFLSETRGLSPIGMTTCDLLLDPAGISALAALGLGAVPLAPFDPTGRSTFPLPIPTAPTLAGLQLELQAISLDPGANSSDLVSSNGLTLFVN